jgi:hypothetical protein
MGVLVEESDCWPNETVGMAAVNVTAVSADAKPRKAFRIIDLLCVWVDAGCALLNSRRDSPN